MTATQYEERIRRAAGALETRLIGRTILFSATVSSTNALLLDCAPGLDEGTVLVADHQTAGRGRLGRSWFSPPGVNLYCSVLLRTEPLRGQLALLSLAAGLAAAEAIDRAAEVQATLKWPNDVLIDERKVGGILVETRGGFVVVGLGLNVNLALDAAPPELRERIGSLALATGRPHDRASCLTAYLAALEHRYDELCQGAGAVVLAAVRVRSATLGRRVTAHLGKAHISGRAAEISDTGELVIQQDDGRREAVRAGDVTHLYS
jgi:BirA family biotin operon repressor/biotin-[acetyl-CoA-carboxylase] ligase